MYVRASMAVASYVTLNSATYSATGAKSIVFISGSAGGYRIKTFAMYMRTYGGALTDQYSMKIDLRGVTGILPSTTVHATTTVYFYPPTIASTVWKLTFNETAMGAIATTSLTASTKYSFSLYNLRLVSTAALTSNIALGSSATAASTTVTYSSGFSNASFVSASIAFSGSYYVLFGP